MALPVTPAQQEMLRASIEKHLEDVLAHGTGAGPGLQKAFGVETFGLRRNRDDVIAFPCHKAEPHDP